MSECSDEIPKKRKKKQMSPKYQRDRTAKKIENGICVRCALPASPGLKLCDFHRQEEKKRQLKRQSEGKCSWCSKPKLPGKNSCQEHLVERNTYRLKRYLGRRCQGCNEIPILGMRWCINCRQTEVEKRLTLKKETLEKYGGCYCHCCGITEITFLSLEHPDKNGVQHRRELNVKAGYPFYKKLKEQGYPKDYRLTVYCYNCNIASGLHGSCVHETEKRFNQYMEKQYIPRIKIEDL